jgi:hydroxymethylglutaryl-CoA lyase
VPQLKDALEVAAGLKRKPGVLFSALYLNSTGLLKALEFPLLHTAGFVMLAASDTFLRKNNNVSLEAALAGLKEWTALFEKHKLDFEQLMISAAFGDEYEGAKETGEVIALTDRALKLVEESGRMPREVTFADTTGWGNPDSVTRLVSEFRSRRPNIAVGLHLHDTRGTGMPNVYAGLLCGVDRFDCSIGGLGGCPFSPGAAGNVPTEDVAFLCADLGIETGINLERAIDCAKEAEKLAGRPLPGKLKSGGVPKNWRAKR